jgi:hypothetical protein
VTLRLFQSSVLDKLEVSEGIGLGLGDLGWGSVVQAAVRAIVVAVDVGSDHLPCLVEGLDLVQSSRSAACGCIPTSSR